RSSTNTDFKSDIGGQLWFICPSVKLAPTCVRSLVSVIDQTAATDRTINRCCKPVINVPVDNDVLFTQSLVKQQ
ncbi:MAG: hypothetical protein JWN70_5657, partial [Planctomycetaceae bacterium]|nr:hypothetical protein [Planctomycetaceae bacterium]